MGLGEHGGRGIDKGVATTVRLSSRESAWGRKGERSGLGFDDEVEGDLIPAQSRGMDDVWGSEVRTHVRAPRRRSEQEVRDDLQTGRASTVNLRPRGTVTVFPFSFFFSTSFISLLFCNSFLY